VQVPAGVSNLISKFLKKKNLFSLEEDVETLWSKKATTVNHDDDEEDDRDTVF